MVAMAQLIRAERASEWTRLLLSRILGGKTQDGSWAVRENDPVAEMNAIYNYVIGNVRYLLDPVGFDMMLPARDILALKIGDCDDMAILVGVLGEAAGHPIKVRAISLDGEFYAHVYVLAGILEPGAERWMPIDTVYRAGVGHAPKAIHQMEIIA